MYFLSHFHFHLGTYSYEFRLSNFFFTLAYKYSQGTACEKLRLWQDFRRDPTSDYKMKTSSQVHASGPTQSIDSVTSVSQSMAKSAVRCLGRNSAV